MKRIAFSYILSLFFLNSVAQDGKSLSEQINVVRPYMPVLAEAVKIASNPEIGDEKPVKQRLQYSAEAEKLDSLAELPVISPEKIKAESISKLHKSYIKIGAGNYRTTLGELYLTNIRSRDMQLGAFIRHHAAQGKLSNDNFSENQASVFIKKIFSTHELQASAIYDRDVVHYYGYDHEAIAPDAVRNVRQYFNYYGAEASLKSRPTKDSVSLMHKIDVMSYSLTDAFKADETRFFAGFNLGSYIYKNLITADLQIDVSNYTSSYKTNNNLVYFTPAYTLRDSAYSFSLGFRIANEHGIRSKFHLYPHITGEYDLSDHLRIYAGLTGDLKKNTYRAFTLENPFLGKNILLLNTNEKLEFFGGFRGNITSQLGFKTQVSYLTMDNMPFFINAPGDSTRFTLMYDGPNSNLLHFTAEATFQQSEKFRLAAQLHAYKFDMAVLLHPWHHPGFKASLLATYNIGGKFLLNGELYRFGKMYARPPAGTGSVEIAGVTDLNAGLEYRYSKVLSAFLKLNNITGSIHERWLNYPGYGFNAVFGASLAF